MKLLYDSSAFRHDALIHVSMVDSTLGLDSTTVRPGLLGTRKR